MALETATYIDALVTTNPDGADQAATADDHLRLLKACLQRTFPKIDAAVSASAGDINVLDGAGAAGVTAAKVSYLGDVSSSLQAQINTKVGGNENYLTSDFTVNTGSNTAVAALTFSVDPNTWYAIEGVLAWENSDAASLVWVFDQTPQESQHMAVGYSNAQAVGDVKNLTGGVITFPADSAGFITVVNYNGLFLSHATTTASAHVAVRGTGADNITLRRGSHIRLRKLS